MTLKELVPPVNLCKKIPAGEFADSALLYVVRHGMNGEVFNDVMVRQDLDHWSGTENYPAPTLLEIIQNCGPAYEWTAKNHPAASKSMIEEALEAWLKIKKIEKETNNEGL